MRQATPVSGSVNIALDVNGQKRNATVEPRTTLLNTLRNHLEPGITGPKLVCDMGTCGACTVMMDGKPVYSCLVLAVDAVGKKLTTVEGLGTPENMNEVQKAFVEHDALMCGFCTPGICDDYFCLPEKEFQSDARRSARSMQGKLLPLRDLSASL